MITFQMLILPRTTFHNQKIQLKETYSQEGINANDLLDKASPSTDYP